MSTKISFRKIINKLEDFMSDIDMSYFVEQLELFMKKTLNENMSENEAIDFLEANFLFNDKKNKPEILLAADILRAIRMVMFDRENSAKLQVSR